MMSIILKDPTPSPSVAPNAPPTAGAVTPSASVSSTPSGDTLPKTGVDATWLVLVALVLVVLGAAALAAGHRRHRTAG